MLMDVHTFLKRLLSIIVKMITNLLFVGFRPGRMQSSLKYTAFRPEISIPLDRRATPQKLSLEYVYFPVDIVSKDTSRALDWNCPMKQERSAQRPYRDILGDSRDFKHSVELLSYKCQWSVTLVSGEFEGSPSFVSIVIF